MQERHDASASIITHSRLSLRVCRSASPPGTPLHDSGLRMSWEPEARSIPSRSFDPPLAREAPRSPSARPSNSLVDAIVHGEANTREELSALLASDARRGGTWGSRVPAAPSEQLPRMFTGMPHCRVYSQEDLWPHSHRRP